MRILWFGVIGALVAAYGTWEHLRVKSVVAAAREFVRRYDLVECESLVTALTARFRVTRRLDLLWVVPCLLAGLVCGVWGESSVPVMIIGLLAVCQAVHQFLTLRAGCRPLGWVAGRPAARVRAVGLNDYVPLGLQRAAWAGIAVLATVTLVCPLVLRRPVLITAAGVVTVVAALVSGVVMRSLVRQPEPAAGHLELYVQDALRGDRICGVHAGQLAMAVWVSIAMVTWRGDDDALSAFGIFLGLALVFAIMISARDVRWRFRDRLWQGRPMRSLA